MDMKMGGMCKDAGRIEEDIENDPQNSSQKLKDIYIDWDKMAKI
jgi:hypothetical protein